jgi:Mg2+-importing ATPase
VIAIFAVNVFLKRPVLETFLFALALAVGLTPQLLPAIISVNLAHGARRMAAAKVIVRRLASIENFGSMDVLCSDKTGTVTESAMRLDGALDLQGKASEKALLYAYLNAVNETGFLNPIDEAIRNQAQRKIAEYRKLDEVPYDFLRRRLSILIDHGGRSVMITKGAFRHVLDVCASAETADGQTVGLAQVSQPLQERFERFGAQGLRTLAVAYKDLGTQAIKQLKHLGVSFKMVTGDNALVAQEVAREVGIGRPIVLTGADVRKMSNEALLRRAGRVNIFAEVEPNQKEQIIRALQKAGHVVGYMGDGINDASALHAADVGISVNTAADVAKEAADIVLLEKDLTVLAEGIHQGRMTFANTLKYVFMATSANFGNMFSMAGASLFLPFLPLLPKQVLLLNLMTDFPEMTIATDSVDADMVRKPRRWDIRLIRRFMVRFGLLSSVFDYATFAVLLLVLNASATQFRTGWFLESVISATLVILVIRSRRAFFRSRPSPYLLIATVLIILAALLIPYSPLAALLGFAPVSPIVLAAVGLIAAIYVASAEGLKRLFYRPER